MPTISRDREFLENLKLGEGVKGVYISVDVDCHDPAFIPGEPGGLSFRDVLNILHILQADVIAADVVEFNPQHDTVDGKTAMVAAKLVRELTANNADSILHTFGYNHIVYGFFDQVLSNLI